MKRQYPSDITKEQFEIIEPLLISANKQTSPREINLYHVFCAILYILKTGCQWYAAKRLSKMVQRLLLF